MENTASRFIGRRATPCRKCSGVSYHVNRFGGVLCSTCSLVNDGEAISGRLGVRNGLYVAFGADETKEESSEPRIDSTEAPERDPVAFNVNRVPLAHRSAISEHLNIFGWVHTITDARGKVFPAAGTVSRLREHKESLKISDRP